MATPVVSVLNMKGGVGKTTISANVFRALFSIHKKKTLLIDFDPQYNLSQLLLTQIDYEQLYSEKKTLWHVINPEETPSIFHISENDFMHPSDVSTYVKRLRFLRGESHISLDLLPGDFRAVRINMMTEPTALRVRRQRFHAFVEQARTVYDLVVLDCNPSSSFMTRTAIEEATHLLIPVRADRYSILGLQMLIDYIHELPNLERIPDTMIVFNNLPGTIGGSQQEIIDELRAHPEHGPRTLAAVVRYSKLLEAKPDYAGFAVDRGGPYSGTIARRLNAVAVELGSRLRLTT